MHRWPTTAEDLAREQDRLAALAPEPFRPPAGARSVGACAVVYGRAGVEGVGWAAAVVMAADEVLARASCVARVEPPFEPGRLALREGPVLEEVVRRLARAPDLLLVAAAGRDHPRRAGLALHLGAVLGVPTIGVTDEPLLATGPMPAPARGSVAPLAAGGAVVACRVRTRGGAKPVVAHAAWRTDAYQAAELVLASCALARWPEPMRAARRLARELRQREASRG